MFNNLSNIKKNNFIVLTILLFVMMLLGMSCNFVENGNYYGYADTGEGTYIIFKLELKDKSNNVFVFTDGVLGPIDEKSTDSVRGFSTKTDLNSFDFQLIGKIFEKYNGTKLVVKKININSSEFSFSTKKKQIEDGFDARFEFVGKKNEVEIIGEIAIYDQEKYPQTIKMKFRKIN